MNEQAKERNIKQKILLRITPGIDPHTHAAIVTGRVDSKFGIAIETGQAEEITSIALALSNIDLYGFHCHVGSQVFDEEGDVYLDASTIMLHFIKKMDEMYGFKTEILNMGGGFGGCTINLVKEDLYDNFIATAKKKYLAKYNREPKVYDVVISDGARRIK